MLGTSLGYIRFFSSNILQHYLESFSSMSIQFSLESIEYLAEKLNNCQSLSHESLSYLTLQVSELISNLLQVIIELLFSYEFNSIQDACKVLRKCRRKDLTADDFAFALKLHDLEVNFPLLCFRYFSKFSSQCTVVIQHQIIIIYSFVE